MHKWSAVKSPLGAQTVLGDRHDPVCEILLQAPSAACGTRPRELSNGWRRKRIRDRSKERSSENLIRQRGQRNDLNPGEFASRAGVRVVVLARGGIHRASLHFQKICPAGGVTRRAHLGLHFPCRSFAWTCVPARANLQSVSSHACVDRIHHFHDLCILGMLTLVVKERKLH